MPVSGDALLSLLSSSVLSFLHPFRALMSSILHPVLFVYSFVLV